MAFINQRPPIQRSALVAQLLREQQRQHSKEPNPQSWGEAAAKAGSRLLQTYMGKKRIDEEMARRGASADNLQKAIIALIEGTTKPGVLVDTVTQDPFAQRPIALDPNVFGTDADVGSPAVAPTVVSALTNMGATSADLGGRPANIPQASTAQDLMGATHVMPDGTTMLNSDMTGAMYETPQMNLGGQPPVGSQIQQAMAQQIAQEGTSQDVVQDRAAGIGAMAQVLMRNPTNAGMGAEMLYKQKIMDIQRQQALGDAKLKNANELAVFQIKEQFKHDLKDGFENFANINISGRNVRSAMKDGVLYIVGKTGKLQPAADILSADDFLNVSNQVAKTQEVNIGKLANLSPGQQDRLVQLETSGNSFIVNSRRARKALARGGGVGSAVGDISVFVDNTARNLGNLTRSLAGTVLKDGSVLTSGAIQQDISKAMSLFGDLPKEQARFVATSINLTYAKALMLNGTRPTNEDFTNSYSAIIGGSNNPETIIENILFEENLLLDGIEGQWNRLAPEEKFKFDRGGGSSAVPKITGTFDQAMEAKRNGISVDEIIGAGDWTEEQKKQLRGQ